jgi:transposase
MDIMYYIGLDVHKKTISYCVKDGSGQVHQEGKIGATRRELDRWIGTLPQPRIMAMEATIFTGWIYDHLRPHAQQVKVAHPLMLRAIAAAKKKNDRIDANKITDCLRCDFLPECHMASTEIRDRRRTLRYRQLLVRQMVQMKNRVSGLLMETGVSYNKQRLHKVGYFRELLSSHEEVHESIRPLLKLSRETIVRLQKTEYGLVSSLERDPLLADRIRRLRTVPGVGTDHGTDLGAGGRGCFALPVDPTSYQLLRALRCGKELSRQGDAHTAVQTAQQAYPTCARGSRQAGAPTRP